MLHERAINFHIHVSIHQCFIQHEGGGNPGAGILPMPVSAMCPSIPVSFKLHHNCFMDDSFYVIIIT